MQNADNKKRIIFIILGIIIFLLIVFLIFKMFTPKEYLIKFDSNGGSKVNSLVVKKDDVIPKPDDPTREGYNFAGWYYENKLFDFNTKVKEDMVLKAKWVEDGKVIGVSLNLGTLSLKPNGTYTLVATISPDNAKNTNLRWTSSDESIVTVDENGKIKAISEGKVIITVITEDGEYTAQCEVIVTADTVSVTDVTISGKSEVEVGKTIKLTATISPKDASNKGVKWESSNTKVATVDKNGNVKGIKSGKVTITVTTDDGSKTATKEITVKEVTNKQEPSTQDPSTTEEEVKVTKIEITGGNSVDAGKSLTLKAVITPDNATNKEVLWESSDTSKATVSSDGVVTGVSAGKVTITAKSKENNSITASIEIEVKDVYKVVYKRKYNNNKVLTGYEVTVYRNNIEWDGFVSMEDGNGKFRKFEGGFAAVEQVNENKNTTTIKIDGDTKVYNVTVTYID